MEPQNEGGREDNKRKVKGQGGVREMGIGVRVKKIEESKRGEGRSDVIGRKRGRRSPRDGARGSRMRGTKKKVKARVPMGLRGLNKKKGRIVC